MDNNILTQKTFDRSLEWNDAGYTGKGVVVWNMEGTSDHGKKTRQRILDAAPDAEVINRPWTLKFSSDKLEYEKVYDPETKTYTPIADFIGKYKPNIMNASLSGGTDKKYKWVRPIITDLQDKNNLIIFNAAGNDGSKGVQGGFIPQENAMYIGACMMFKNNPNDIRLCGYSSVGDEFEEVDFCSWTGPAGTDGTSFSSPYLAGFAALLKQRYGPMTQGEIYNYFKMTAKPLMMREDAHIIDFIGGRYIYDLLSGYGVPILPHVSQHYISLKIGDNQVYTDGIPYDMDTAPFIKNSRTFVPIAFVALQLGAKVIWNPLFRKVTITKGDTEVVLYIDKTKYYINNIKYEMDTSPFIKDGRTFVPISFIALALGCRVTWEAKKQIVQILEMEVDGK